MFFSISKASFLCHSFRVYLMRCSPLICILFVIILLAKLIIFLNLSVCSVNYSSVQLTRPVIALLPPILWKAYAKLLKQKLLYVFWWNSSTGAAGWNTMFSVIFALPIGTANNWYVFVSWPLIFFDKVLIEIRFTCPEIFF